MNGILDQLIQYTRERWTFDERTYPELRGTNEADCFTFAVKHSALHFAKTAGKIVAVSEKVDHGEEIDRSELTVQISKSLINTLRLAELLNMSEDDLYKAVQGMK